MLKKTYETGSEADVDNKQCNRWLAAAFVAGTALAVELSIHPVETINGEAHCDPHAIIWEKVQVSNPNVQLSIGTLACRPDHT